MQMAITMSETGQNNLHMQNVATSMFSRKKRESSRAWVGSPVKQIGKSIITQTRMFRFTVSSVSVASHQP